MSSLILINGKALHNPAPEFSYEGEQLVDSARNANGELTATKLGSHRLMKLSGIVWRGLTRQEWQEIRQEIEKFYVDITYYDEYYDDVITRKFYWGDCKSVVAEWDRTGTIMIPIKYKECSCNIIDIGV